MQYVQCYTAHIQCVRCKTASIQGLHSNTAHIECVQCNTAHIQFLQCNTAHIQFLKCNTAHIMFVQSLHCRVPVPKQQAAPEQFTQKRGHLTKVEFPHTHSKLYRYKCTSTVNKLAILLMLSGYYPICIAAFFSIAYSSESLVMLIKV
jgi:hypothetical protein